MILAVGLALRLWSLRHGLPFAYNVDEEQHFVSKAARFLRTGDLDPGYFENPPGLTYVLWAAFAVRFFGEDVGSLFRNDPGAFYLTGRLIVAVLGTATIAATYGLAARLARDARAGLIAAALVATAFIPVWYSKLALNDMAAVLPATVAVTFALRHLDEGRRRDLLVAAVCAGLAASLKYTAGAALLAVLLAASIGTAVVSLLVALAAAVLLNPWLALDPGRVLDAMRSQGERSAVAKVGADSTPAFVYYLQAYTWGIGWPAAVAALGGLGFLARGGRRRLVVVIAPAVALLAFISLFDRAFARWALPTYPLVAALAGLALVRVAARTPWPRLVATVAGVAVCVPGTLAVVHLDRLLGRTDTRLEARRYLLRETVPGTRIVVEPTLPSRLLTGRLGSKPFSVLTRGFDIVPRAADIDRYRELGACYVLVQHTYAERVRSRDRVTVDAYYARLEAETEVVRRFSPFAADERVPLHFDWSFDYYPRAYERPGTVVTVYRLSRCTPSTATFDATFRNPYRDALDDAAA